MPEAREENKSGYYTQEALKDRALGREGGAHLRDRKEGREVGSVRSNRKV